MKNKFTLILKTALLSFFVCSFSMGNAQTPGSVSTGLTLWLKANAGTTTSGVNVTGWTDQSAAATNVTVTGSPDFVNASSGYNYNPYVNFTLSSATGGDYLKTPTLNLRTFFWVAKLDNLSRKSTHMATFDNVTNGQPCNGCPIHGGENGGAVAQYHEFNYGRALFHQAGVWRKNGTDVGVSYNTPHSGKYDIVSALGGTVVPTNVFMGGQLSSGSFNGRLRDWVGPVGEIIAYSGSLTAVEANKVESYLAVKYGITLGGNGSTAVAYNSPTGTTIWNANSGYHYEVAGIGRDMVLEGLDQPKSHSINTPADAIIMASNDFTTPVTMTDGEYLLWGHNNSSVAYTCQNLVHASPSTTMAAIWPREWRTQKTGNPSGNVIIAVDMSVLLGPSGSGTTDNSSVRLLLDDNNAYGDASAGEHTYSPNAGFAATGGQLYFTVPFSDIQSGQGFFKLGTINSPPAVSFATSSNTICAGTAVTFTASSVNGGTAPVYQWQLNGANIATGATYSTSTLNDGDLVSVVLTSNALCVSPTTANSTTLTMVVTPPLVPTVTNAASNTTICAGTNITFTATPTNGGSGPVYQWQVNGANVGTGSTYSSSGLNNGDVVSVELTSNQACTSPLVVNSNSITITVNPLVTPSATVSASSNPICAGTNVTFNATPTNGGTSPAYQWFLNGTGVGTGSSYSSLNLNNGDVVSVMLTSNANCASPTTANSNTVTMVVIPSVVPSATIVASTMGICAGTAVSFSATSTNGGTTPAYQWQVNGGSVGTGTLYTTTGLNNGDVVTVSMTSNAGCALPATVISNPIIMSVTTTPVASFNYLPMTLTETNSTASFQDQSSNATAWLWDFGVAGASSGSQNPSYTFPGIGTYTVTLYASNGICIDSVSHVVIVDIDATYFIPNTFTPNGDSINDYFSVVGTGISAEGFEMNIFNRWGNVVYETSDITKPWKGNTNSGAEAPDGTYSYILVFKLGNGGEFVKKSGTVTLFR